MVAALAVTQTIGYGVLYYAFSVADKALAPLGAVALAQAAGYARVMAAVALACVVAAFALPAYHRVSFRQTSNQGVPS
ncbi:hypothetical protein [Streptosporangium canum]|uniref:hypothetical protein n=1 Tax=Streptosporangium canum TaxID=324952 RepID=UPI0037B0B20D